VRYTIPASLYALASTGEINRTVTIHGCVSKPAFWGWPMSNALTFLGLAEKVLTEEKRPLSPSEIWKIAAAKNYDSLLRSTKGKTPANTLYAQMSTNIGRDDTEFVKYGDRPVRYYLKTLVKDPAELEDIATTEAKVPELFNYKESQLHAFLTRFVHNKFNALCKTIRHHLSPKKVRVIYVCSAAVLRDRVFRHSTPSGHLPSSNHFLSDEAIPERLDLWQLYSEPPNPIHDAREQGQELRMRRGPQYQAR
jgi:hypothetical protein